MQLDFAGHLRRHSDLSRFSWQRLVGSDVLVISVEALFSCAEVENYVEILHSVGPKGSIRETSYSGKDNAAYQR